MLESKHRSKNYLIIATGLVLTVITAFWAWRVQYGGADISGMPDESYYLAIPFRMLFGDALFFDETWTNQMFAFLTYPIMLLWNKQHLGDTTGIILSFRYIWLFFHMSVSIILYLIVAKRNRYLSAGIISCLYAVALPNCISQLNYNTISLAAASILAVVLYLEIDSKGVEIIKGLLLATIVLCNPYALIIYILYLVFEITKRLHHEDFEGNHCRWTGLLRFHIGILILLLPFIAYLTSIIIERGGLYKFYEAIRLMLQNDKDHDMGSGLHYIFQKLYPAYQFLKWYKLAGPIAMAIVYCSIKKAFSQTKLLCIFLGYSVLCTIYSVAFFRNHIALIFSIFIGLFLFTSDWHLLRETRIGVSAIFCVSFVLCTHLASNQNLFSVAWTSIPGGIISWIALCDYIGQDKAIKIRLPLIELTALSAFIIISCLLVNDAKYVYWDKPINNLTYKIDVGPMKGIHTTYENYTQYNNQFSQIQALELKENDRLIFYNTRALNYLIANREVCCSATWNPKSPCRYFFCRPQIQEYYRSHPQKVPNVLYVDIYSLWNELDSDDYQVLSDEGFSLDYYNEYCMVYRR